MNSTRLLSAIIFAAVAGSAGAAAPESFAGKPPSHLLKQDKAFASTYRAAIKDQDLPNWTKQLAIGFPAETVEVDGKKLVLMSACNPNAGCKEERFYLLYEPGNRAFTGFFFLSPNTDAPGDHRMALSRWIGKVPPKERSDFLLQRALQDALDPEKDASKLPTASAAANSHSHAH